MTSAAIGTEPPARRRRHSFTLPRPEAQSRAREKERLALAWLSRYGITIPPLLSAALGIAATAAYPIIYRLVRIGFAETRKTAEVGAKTLVVITPHGRAIAAHQACKPMPDSPIDFEPGLGRGSVPHSLQLQLSELLVRQAGGVWEAMECEDWREQGFSLRGDALVKDDTRKSVALVETQIQTVEHYSRVILGALNDIEEGRSTRILLLSNGHAGALGAMVRAAAGLAGVGADPLERCVSVRNVLDLAHGLGPHPVDPTGS